MQDKAALEKQKRDAWAPSEGSLVFVPRLKGKFKVLTVSGNQVSVKLGALTVKVGIDEVRRV